MKTFSGMLALGALALMAAAGPAARAADPAKPAAAEESFTPPEVTNDNILWYRYQPLSHDPFINNAKNAAKGNNVAKNMFHFEHTDTGGLVWNSFTMTGLLSDKNEPAARGTTGAEELYMTYRGDVSTTGFGRPPITAPYISDLMFEFGGDANYKNDAYGARRRFLLLGPIIYFDLPGSVTLAFHYAQEWNQNSITHINPNYHPTWNTEFSYTEYFDTKHMYRLEGEFNMTGAKGNDTLYNRAGRVIPIKTKTEFYIYNQIVADAGKLLLGMPEHKVDAFVGFQYWINKFGYPIAARYGGGGALELTPYFGVGVHF